MTCCVSTTINLSPLWSLITMTIVVELMVATASLNVDEERANGADMDWGCAAAAVEYQHFGDVHSVPTTLVEGSHLQVCEYRQRTCCSAEMESTLKIRGRSELVRAIAARVVLAKQTFLSRAAKFDAFFVELLNISRQNLEETFGQAYGYDSQMFVDLYRDLKSYYKGTDLSLSDSLDRFFTRLSVQLLHVSGSEVSSACVAEQIDRLQAFGNIPHRLTSLVRRAFIVARNFVHGLAIGRDTIAALADLEPGVACIDDVTRLLYCWLCRGQAMTSSTRRCRGHCSNIVRACLAVPANVNSAWNDYLYELLQLSEKLVAPYNIEHVADTLQRRLSDAVTTFQQNIDDFTSAQVQSCVESSAGETWSSAATADQRVQRDPVRHRSGRRHDRHRAQSSTDADASALSRLIRETRGRLSVTHDLWRLLPERVCDELAVTAFDNDSLCWDGRSYSHDIYYDVNSANPPLSFDFHRPSSSDYIIYHLQTTANKLRNAFHGVDVSWIDSGDDGYVSGSGSDTDEIIGQDPLHDRSSRTNNAVVVNTSYLQRLLIVSLQIVSFSCIC